MYIRYNKTRYHIVLQNNVLSFAIWTCTNKYVGRYFTSFDLLDIYSLCIKTCVYIRVHINLICTFTYQLFKIWPMFVCCVFDHYGLLMDGKVRCFPKNISALKTVIILRDLDLSDGGYRHPWSKPLARTWLGDEGLVQRQGMDLSFSSFRSWRYRIIRRTPKIGPAVQ